MGKDNFTDTIIAEKRDALNGKYKITVQKYISAKKILEKSSKAAFEKKNMDSQTKGKTVAVQLY